MTKRTPTLSVILLVGSVALSRIVVPQERYVESAASNPVWNGDGSSGAPFQNIIEGVLDVPSGGYVIIRAGTYAEKMFIKKPMQLRSFGGAATVGRRVPPGFITCDGTMTSDNDGDWIDDGCEEALAQKYSPIIYHSNYESNLGLLRFDGHSSTNKMELN